MDKEWFDSQPIIALAPMADYTDQPFSLLCREISGKDFIIFREMVSAEAIVRGSVKTLKMCEIDERERPLVIQIFGDKPEIMARAAKIIDEKFQPNGIDINMGCPVPKIASKTKSGAALLKNQKLAVEIVRAIKKQKLKCPLSVKTRLGWSDKSEIITFAVSLEEAGIDALTVHGRTKLDGYAGSADWQAIAEVKRLISIPLIANGDILCFSDITRCLHQTLSNGVMVGRGALGNPWVLSKKFVLKSRTVDEIRQAILRHAELHIMRYGEKGIISLRKHLIWYFHGSRIQGISEIKKIRAGLARVSSFDDLKLILSSL